MVNIDEKSLNLVAFEGFGSKTSRKISITRACSFGFPSGFYTDSGLDKYTHASLFYDSGKKVIGIHFSESELPGSFTLVVNKVGEKKSASFVARSFFNFYNIDPVRVKGRYEPEKIVKEGVGEIFVIQLKEDLKSNDNESV